MRYVLTAEIYYAKTVTYEAHMMQIDLFPLENQLLLLKLSADKTKYGLYIVKHSNRVALQVMSIKNKPLQWQWTPPHKIIHAYQRKIRVSCQCTVSASAIPRA